MSTLTCGGGGGGGGVGVRIAVATAVAVVAGETRSMAFFEYLLSLFLELAQAGNLHSVKNIPAKFREWLAETLCHSAILGWAVEHFESDSRNLAGMFLHNSVDEKR